MEGDGARCNNQTKDDDDFKDNDKNDNKDNNQLTTVYRRDATGNVGAREGGKEGEEPERRGGERKRGAE